mmetsp:Transcript_5209/g.7685  ORF Transcript_5209/g.7685 Transcript_5209/m.7685 type:complete len:258 (-) Transcript_5209:7-780(-)
MSSGLCQKNQQITLSRLDNIFRLIGANSCSPCYQWIIQCMNNTQWDRNIRNATSLVRRIIISHGAHVTVIMHNVIITIVSYHSMFIDAFHMTCTEEFQELFFRQAFFVFLSCPFHNGIAQTLSEHGLPQSHATVKVDLLSHVQTTRYCHGRIELARFTISSYIIGNDNSSHAVANSHNKMAFKKLLLDNLGNLMNIRYSCAMKHLVSNHGSSHESTCNHHCHSGSTTCLSHDKFLHVFFIGPTIQAMQEYIKRHVFV